MRVAMLSTGTTAGVRAQAESARLLGRKERLPAKGAAAQKQRHRAEGRERRRSQPAPACGGPRELRAAYARRRLQQRQLQEAPARRRLRVLTPCNQISSVLGYTTEGRNNLFYKAVWFLKESHWL